MENEIKGSSKEEFYRRKGLEGIPAKSTPESVRYMNILDKKHGSGFHAGKRRDAAKLFEASPIIIKG